MFLLLRQAFFLKTKMDKTKNMILLTWDMTDFFNQSLALFAYSQNYLKYKDSHTNKLRLKFMCKIVYGDIYIFIYILEKSLAFIHF